MNTKSDIQTVAKSQTVASDCFAIAFHRPTGSAAFTVNGFPVPDGGTYTIGQNVGDVDRTDYEIVFAAVGVRECVVTRIKPVNDGQVAGRLL
jgi:hypothetical protein